MAAKNTKTKGIKVKLTVEDRLILPSFLPEKGDMVQMALVKSVLKKVELSTKDYEELELQANPEGGIRWNKEKEKELSAEFTTGEIELLHTGVNLKNTAKELEPNQFDIAIKIKEWAGHPFSM